MRQALLALGGVIDASVEYDEKRADVHYDPNVVQPAAMVAAVDGIGFAASVIETDGDAS